MEGAIAALREVHDSPLFDGMSAAEAGRLIADCGLWI